MQSSRHLVIYGAGGAGREFAFALSLGCFWKVKGFIDDTKPVGSIIDLLPILGHMDWLSMYEGNVAMCIIGFPKVKRKLVEQIKKNCPGVSFPLVIDENSIVSNFVVWGEGCIVGQPYNHLTVDITIGDFVWINSYNGIGHGTSIGAYTTLYTGIQVGGDCVIGEDCVIGTGAIIKPGVKIGNNVVVGGGSMVVKDVPDNVVIVGNPAKVLRNNI